MLVGQLLLAQEALRTLPSQPRLGQFEPVSPRPKEGYIPRITASRHLIGRASLVISLARSISL